MAIVNLSKSFSHTLYMSSTPSTTVYSYKRKYLKYKQKYLDLSKGIQRRTAIKNDFVIHHGGMPPFIWTDTYADTFFQQCQFIADNVDACTSSSPLCTCTARMLREAWAEVEGPVAHVKSRDLTSLNLLLTLPHCLAALAGSPVTSRGRSSRRPSPEAE